MIKEPTDVGIRRFSGGGEEGHKSESGGGPIKADEKRLQTTSPERIPRVQGGGIGEHARKPKRPLGMRVSTPSQGKKKVLFNHKDQIKLWNSI